MRSATLTETSGSSRLVSTRTFGVRSPRAARRSSLGGLLLGVGQALAHEHDAARALVEEAPRGSQEVARSDPRESRRAARTPPPVGRARFRRSRASTPCRRRSRGSRAARARCARGARSISSVDTASSATRASSSSMAASSSSAVWPSRAEAKSSNRPGSRNGPTNARTSVAISSSRTSFWWTRLARPPNSTSESSERPR